MSIMPGIEARAPERTETQQRIGGVAEHMAGLPADLRDRRVDLRGEIGRIGLAVGVEVGADFGGDGEAGRHRQAERRHLVQIRALAAEQILHLPPSFGALGAEGIDPFRHYSLLTCARPTRKSQLRACSPKPKLTHPTPWNSRSTPSRVPST